MQRNKDTEVCSKPCQYSDVIELGSTLIVVVVSVSFKIETFISIVSPSILKKVAQKMFHKQVLFARLR